MDILEGLATICAVGILIVLAFSFFVKYVLPVIIGIIIICCIIGSISNISKEKRERLKEIEQERQFDEAQVIAKQEKQESYYNEMINLGEESISLFELLPKDLETAEKYLDRAESDFSKGAFIPFWDSIEKAAKSLSYFVKRIHLIEAKSSQYTKLIGEYESTPPQFPLLKQSIKKLGVGTATAKRMDSIVQSTQCDFQFSSIYNQLKTNQILIAGFTNLANALREMTSTISSSISDLITSVDETGLVLNESMGSIHSEIGYIANDYSEVISRREKREVKALEMLDNIQRGRKPF